MSVEIFLPRKYWFGTQTTQNTQNIIYDGNEINLIKSYNEVAYKTECSISVTKQLTSNNLSVTAEQFYTNIIKQKEELEKVYNESENVKKNTIRCFDDAIITNEACKERVKTYNNEISNLTATAAFLRQQINNLKCEIRRKQNEHDNEEREYKRLQEKNKDCDKARFSATIGATLIAGLLTGPIGGAAAAATTWTASSIIVKAIKSSEKKLEALRCSLNNLNNSIGTSKGELNHVNKRLEEANQAYNSAVNSLENDSKKPQVFSEILDSLAKIQSFIQKQQSPLNRIIAKYRFYASLPRPPTAELSHQHKAAFLNDVKIICQNQ